MNHKILGISNRVNDKSELEEAFCTLQRLALVTLDGPAPSLYGRWRIEVSGYGEGKIVRSVIALKEFFDIVDACGSQILMAANDGMGVWMSGRK